MWHTPAVSRDSMGPDDIVHRIGDDRLTNELRNRK